MGARARRCVCAGVVAAGALATILGVAGCESGSRPWQQFETQPAPAYEEVVRRHNERAERLSHLWARAAVVMRYDDSDGRRRSEQGEGHLQLRQPSDFALSVGKLGEVLFWLGADDDRFWWFDLSEDKHVSVGRHANVGRPCCRDAGLPMHPLDIVELLGVSPMPTPGAHRASSAPVGVTNRSARGEVIVDLTSHGGFKRMVFDPQTFEPLRIELYDPAGREMVLAATLEQYANVQIRGMAGGFPRVATRIVITHFASDTEVRLHLEGMNDGATGRRLRDEAFDFDSLLRAFAPREIDVLDEDCPTPAHAVGASAGVR